MTWRISLCGSFGVVAVCWIALAMPCFAKPGWVKEAIKAAESAPPPHEDAAAWILLTSEEVELSKGGKSKTKVRRAVKLLRSSGEGLCDISVTTSERRKVSKLRGWLITHEGKTNKLKKDNQVSIATDLAAGYYDDAMEFMAGFDHVDVGDVVAYEYVVTNEPEWGKYWHSFVFQWQQPVLKAECRVRIPKGWTIVSKLQAGESIIESDADRGRSWIDNNLPYQPEEPLMPPWSYVAKEVNLCCFSNDDAKGAQFASWNEAADWVEEIQAIPETPTNELDRLANEQFGHLPSTAEKISAISGFVRDEIRYVAVEIGEGRIIPRAPATTLLNRYGDCKDKTALMRSLLASQGIASSAVLAAVQTPVDPDLPTPFQFNHAIVGVHRNEVSDFDFTVSAVIGDWLFYDPTCTWLDLGDLPVNLCGSKLLIASDIDSPLVRVPYLPTDDNLRCYNIAATLNEDGSMQADIRVTDFGQRAARTADYIDSKDIGDQIDGWKSLYDDIIPGVDLTDYRAETEGDSTWVTFRISAPGYLERSGDLQFLTLDLVPAQYLPELKKGDRFHPIWFGSSKKYEADISWSFPDGWVADVSPDSVDLMCEAVSFNSALYNDSSGVTVQWTFEMDGTVMDASSYSEVRNFRTGVSRKRNLKVLVSEYMEGGE